MISVVRSCFLDVCFPTAQVTPWVCIHTHTHTNKHNGNMKGQQLPDKDHKDKPRKIKPTKGVLTVLPFSNLVFFSLLRLLSLFFFLFTLHVSQLSRCCAAAAVCSNINIGSFVLRARHLGGWLKLLEVQTHKTGCPPSPWDKHKELGKTNLSLFHSLPLSPSADFQGQRCLCSPTSPIVKPLLPFLLSFNPLLSLQVTFLFLLLQPLVSGYLSVYLVPKQNKNKKKRI